MDTKSRSQVRNEHHVRSFGLKVGVVVVIGTAVLAGCHSEMRCTCCYDVPMTPDEVMKAHPLRSGRWYDYYERGIVFLNCQHYTYAENDFRAALKVRTKDLRNANTYGMNTVDYFARRELGYALYRQYRFDEAIHQLKLSLCQETSSRAKFYLNRAYKDRLQATGEDRSAPKVKVIDRYIFHRTPEVNLQGSATDDQFVKSITINKEPVFIELAQPEVAFDEKRRVPRKENVFQIQAEDLMGRRSEPYVVKTIFDTVPPLIHYQMEQPNFDRTILNLMILDDHQNNYVEVNGERYPCDPTSECQFTLELSRPSNRFAHIVAADRAGNTTTLELNLDHVTDFASTNRMSPSFREYSAGSTSWFPLSSRYGVHENLFLFQTIHCSSALYVPPSREKSRFLQTNSNFQQKAITLHLPKQVKHGVPLIVTDDRYYLSGHIRDMNIKDISYCYSRMTAKQLNKLDQSSFLCDEYDTENDASGHEDLALDENRPYYLCQPIEKEQLLTAFGASQTGIRSGIQFGRFIDFENNDQMMICLRAQSRDRIITYYERPIIIRQIPDAREQLDTVYKLIFFPLMHEKPSGQHGSYQMVGDKLENVMRAQYRDRFQFGNPSRGNDVPITRHNRRVLREECKAQLADFAVWGTFREKEGEFEIQVNVTRNGVEREVFAEVYGRVDEADYYIQGLASKIKYHFPRISGHIKSIPEGDNRVKIDTGTDSGIRDNMNVCFFYDKNEVELKRSMSRSNYCWVRCAEGRVESLEKHTATVRMENEEDYQVIRGHYNTERKKPGKYCVMFVTK